MTSRTGIIAALLLLIGFAPAAGQGAPGGQPLDPTSDLTPRELQRMLDTYVIVQAQDVLQLNETQYAQLIPRLRALQTTRRRIQQERQQILQALMRLSNPQNPTVDDAAIRDRLKALQALDERSAIETRKAYDAIDQVLDVRQQARFRFFEEQMERRKLELLIRARQNNRSLRRPGF
jgi:hypothetical protein